MMKTDHTAILADRNRTRLPRKVYLYEAMSNMLDGLGGGTVSDNVQAILACVLEKCGRKMAFLKPRDRLRMKEIHRVLTYNQ